MSKYDLTHWSDYVRGLGDAASRAELAAHLALPGSGAARRSVATFSRLLDFAARDREAEPPAGLVRGVKALGSLLQPRAAGWGRRLLSLLVFDSAATPLAQGVRGLAEPSDRQLIFKVADYLVDMRLEQDPPTGSYMVVGQLLKEEGEVAPVADVQVLAASENRFVGRSRTGLYGEFQAEGLPGDDLHLFFLVSSEVCLEVPISSALAGR